MKSSLLVPVLLCLFAAPLTHHSIAAPITFTFSGTGSGSLSPGGPGLLFTDAAFTITAVADTANREGTGPVYLYRNDSASIWIEGIGTLSFMIDTVSFLNDANDTVGFSRAGADLLQGPTSAALDGWDMLSSTGPIAGDVRLLSWPTGLDPSVPRVRTDGGLLVFADGTAPGVFTAVVTEAVPDPATTLLLIAGAFGVLIALRLKLVAAS